MNFVIQYELQHSWPELAWVAELLRGSETIRVRCGVGVEHRADWYCEAVWDGNFSSGDFDRTDIVAGSGGRIRDDVFVFVSAGSLLDRLHFIELGNRILVSNSLSALIAESEASIDVTYPHYQKDLGTICDGLDKICDRLRTSLGDVCLVYFENLVWDGNQCQIQAKPRPTRDFSTFESYRNFMESTMQNVVVNAIDSARSFCIDPLVALSNGYDSPTVAALAKRAGVTRAFTIAIDRDGNDDSGSQIGEALDLDTEFVDREAWRKLDYPEVDCIAGCGACGEVAFAGMAERLHGRLLLSGFWGGAIWDRWCEYSDPTFPDHDGSGLCFTEWRLRLGFIHCPAAFWGGLQIADLVRISQSGEMRPWSVAGRYDRPVCRRIVEEAGIPREWFGIQKHGSSDQLLTMSNFLSEKSDSDYRSWIWRNAFAWWRKGRIPPYPVLGQSFEKLLVYGVVQPLRRLVIPVLRRLADFADSDSLRSIVDNIRQTAARWEEMPILFRRYTFPWALEKSLDKYREKSQRASTFVHSTSLASDTADTAVSGAYRTIE